MKAKLLTFATLLIATATGAFAQNPDRPGPRGQRPDPAAIAAFLVIQFDRDQDGALSADEFKTAMREHRQMMPAKRPDREERPADRPRGPRDPEQAMERLRQAFGNADVDGSGTLTQAEVATALEAMRPPRRPRGPAGE